METSVRNGLSRNVKSFKLLDKVLPVGLADRKPTFPKPLFAKLVSITQSYFLFGFPKDVFSLEIYLDKIIRFPETFVFNCI